MASKKPVSPEDSSLFREAVGEVKPVSSNKQHLEPRKPLPEPRRSQSDDDSVMQELLSDFSEIDLLETGEHASYTSPGVQRGVLRNLKSGKYAIQAEMDLHGLKREQAKKALVGFLADAQSRQHTCVRVIHGRGRRTAESAPVLKPAVTRWLMHHKQVLAFCSARDSDGGTGAVYVLLRKSKK